jgi:hypothetical protein
MSTGYIRLVGDLSSFGEVELADCLTARGGAQGSIEQEGTRGICPPCLRSSRLYAYSRLADARGGLLRAV